MARTSVAARPIPDPPAFYGTGLFYKAYYNVDETEHSGAPDKLSIRARRTDLCGGFKVKRKWPDQVSQLEPVVGTSFLPD
jgi:hypothetical protein